MKVVFRADASIYIGSGHIMRCLVLAKLLIANVHQVVFATRPQKGDFVAHLKTMGIDVVELFQPKKSMPPMHDSDYEAWLQVGWQDDAKDFIKKITAANLVVVDHYGININWEVKVSNALNSKIFSIDDIVREHFADIILDQTFGRYAHEYKKNRNHCTVLAGSAYSLLGSDFSILRHSDKQCKLPHNKYKVLVSMGAIDKCNATLAVLQQLNIINDIDLEITVLLSGRSPSYESVKAFCAEQHNIVHLDFTNTMAQLMIEHHIAIGAPGSTSWERACLGLPSIIVPIAENQKDIALNVSNSGAAILLEFDRISIDFKAAFNEITLNWKKYHKASLQLTDGLGAKRVITEIEKLFV